MLGYVIAVDIDSGINADLTFEIVGFKPEEGEELFSLTKVDTQRASINVTSDLLDKWGNYTLTVKVSTYFKRNC